MSVYLSYVLLPERQLHFHVFRRTAEVGKSNTVLGPITHWGLRRQVVGILKTVVLAGGSGLKEKNFSLPTIGRIQQEYFTGFTNFRHSIPSVERWSWLECAPEVQVRCVPCPLTNYPCLVPLPRQERVETFRRIFSWVFRVKCKTGSSGPSLSSTRFPPTNLLSR